MRQIHSIELGASNLKQAQCGCLSAERLTCGESAENNEGLCHVQRVERRQQLVLHCLRSEQQRNSSWNEPLRRTFRSRPTLPHLLILCTW